VQGLFGNGGREAWVSRVAGAGAAAARVTLVDRAGGATLRVGAGYRGVEEVGTWGNDLYVEIRDNPEFSTPLAATRPGNTPGRLQGNAFAASTVDLTVPPATPAKKLRINVDSGPNFDITFDAASVPVLAAATPDDVAKAINRIAGSRVVASASAGGLLIVSRQKGATSRVEAVAAFDDPTRTQLGLNLAAATGAAGPVGTYDEVQVGGFGGLQVNDWVRLDDGISSDWVQITQLEQRAVMGGGIELHVHFTPPPAANQNEYRTQDNASLSTTEFDLVVRQQGAADPAPVPVETWEKVSMNPAAGRYAPSLVNDVFSGSAYVVLIDQNPGGFNGRDAPALGSAFRLGLSTPPARCARSPGRQRRRRTDDGAVHERAHLLRHDAGAVAPRPRADGVRDASAPSRARRSTTARIAVTACTSAKRRWDATRPVRSRSARCYRGAKVYGALYWPWITVTDPIGAGPNPTRTIPPSGHVAGVYARIDQTRGIWKAPAGDEALVRGAIDVETTVTDADHTDLVKNGSVNGIRPIAGVGIVLDASRTLSTDTRWLYVNVRLLFNYVKSSLRDGLRWVKQEPNREALWGMVKFGSVTPFLLRLYQAGAFGPGTPADVFTVICGPENNPPDEIALGNLKIEVYFYPSRPAETILIVVGQQESGATAAER